MSMEKFKTRKRANAATRVYLIDPATGQATEDWVEVVSSLSDSFRAAKEVAMQDAAEASMERDEGRRAEIVRDAKRGMHAALLSAWSFDTPCTREAALEFLAEAPQVVDMLVVVADDHRRFFANDLGSYTAGPLLKSDSPSPSPETASPSDSTSKGSGSKPA